METENSIINAFITTKIEDYIYENGELCFRLKGFIDDISVYCFSFPNSFADEHSKRQLKNAKLKSSYELMNVFREKVAIEQANLNLIKEDEEYCYLQIEYFTKPNSETTSIFKYEKHSFIVMQTGDPEVFKLAYHKGMYVDYIKFIINIETINLENEIHKEAIQNLEKIIYAICQKTNIEIPKDINVKKFENIEIKAPEILDFIELFKLVTRNLFDDSDYKKDSKKLYLLFKKGINEIEMHEKFRDIIGEYFLVEDQVCIQDSTFFSDWKFDPEDIETGITSMLKTEFKFDYPSETFSHDLFPYINVELAKQNLELINCDTFGDSYLFFLVNKNEVDKVLEISHSVGIKFERCM